MGLRIIEGTKINEGPDCPTAAVLYCSTSGTALPMVFNDSEEADAFMQKHGDVRSLCGAEQMALFDEWVKNGRR